MSRTIYTADSIGQAVALKNASNAYLSGGTQILRGGSSVTEGGLIMLKKIPDLYGISMTQEGLVRIGGMTTFTEALEDDRVPGYLKTALGYMASATKRNMATVAGNISLLRDDSYLAAVLIAAHARIELVLRAEDAEKADMSGEYEGIIRREELRTQEGKELVRETICTGRYLRLHEAYRDALITAILVRSDARVVSKRYANTAESHSFMTLAIGYGDGHYRTGITVKNSGVYFLGDLSEIMDRGEASDQRLMDYAKSWQGLDIPDDIFGSADYKRYLLGVTLADLLKRLNGQDKAAGQIAESGGSSESSPDHGQGKEV